MEQVHSSDLLRNDISAGNVLKKHLLRRILGHFLVEDFFFIKIRKTTTTKNKHIYVYVITTLCINALGVIKTEPILHLLSSVLHYKKKVIVVYISFRKPTTFINQTCFRSDACNSLPIPTPQFKYLDLSRKGIFQFCVFINTGNVADI